MKVRFAIISLSLMGLSGCGTINNNITTKLPDGDTLYTSSIQFRNAWGMDNSINSQWRCHTQNKHCSKVYVGSKSERGLGGAVAIYAIPAAEIAGGNVGAAAVRAADNINVVSKGGHAVSSATGGAGGKATSIAQALSSSAP